MSLIAFAARRCFIEVVSGRTWAGANVLDSEVEPLTKIANHEVGTSPVIAVYTGTIKARPEGRDNAGARPEVEMTVQIYCPPRIRIGSGQGAVTYDTGAGIALAMSFIERQIWDALTNTQDSNLFARAWRKIVPKISETETNSYILDAEDGTRILCREISWTLETLNEPPYGQPIQHGWQMFDAALRSLPPYVGVADALKSLIESPSGWQDWQKIQAALALTSTAVSNLGLVPSITNAQGGPVELEEIIVTGDLEVVEPEFPA